MLKICLSKKKKSKFHDLIHAWVKEVGIGYQNVEILKFVPSRLLELLIQDNNQGNKSFFIVGIPAKKYAQFFWKSEPKYAYKHYAYEKTCD